MQRMIHGEYADKRHRDPGNATNQQQQRPAPVAQQSPHSQRKGCQAYATGNQATIAPAQGETPARPNSEMVRLSSENGPR